MARLKSLFGNFNGKLGGLVGYTLNGEDIVRTLGESTKPPTVKQLVVRKKIKVVTHMMSIVLKYINSGFSFAVKGTNKKPFNEAVSCNFKNATTGVYPEITLDYSKILVSKGSLAPALNPLIVRWPDGLEFKWEMQAPGPIYIDNDRAMLLIYFPVQQECLCVLTGAERKECRQFVALEPDYLEREMQAYIAFIANDRTGVSDSVWVAV